MAKTWPIAHGASGRTRRWLPVIPAVLVLSTMVVDYGNHLVRPEH
jgi:hypothetical protein